MQQSELIQSALRKLGPEKVRNALAAFEHYERNRMSGDRCFLGQSFGGAGSLIRQLRARYGSHGEYPFHWVGEVLGLTVEEIRAIIAAFDDVATGVHHDELERMAQDYLASCEPPVEPPVEPAWSLEAEREAADVLACV